MNEQFNPKVGDQWKHYTEKDDRTMGNLDNVFHFWRDNGKHLPAVQQMAYDFLAILAMTSEVDRAFSGAKNTLDDKRTRVSPAVFEATELEKHWMKTGLGDNLGHGAHPCLVTFSSSGRAPKACLRRLQGYALSRGFTVVTASSQKG